MVKITMPQAGQTMEEGQIVSWRKQEGEEVFKGEVLLEIETDKATVEVESSDDGILRKILCPEGIAVPIHAPIAVLAAADEDIGEELEAVRAELKAILKDNPSLIEALNLQDAGDLAGAEESAPEAKPGEPVGAAEIPTASATKTGIKASPAARKAALERGIRIEEVPAGSGPGGRVLSGDVESYAGRAVPQSGPMKKPLAGMRRAIARNLLLSKQTIPHFYMKLTIDASPLMAAYRAEKAKYPCTLNDLIAFFCACVVMEFPAFRSRIEGDEIVEFPAASIGIAVGMEDGLRVPVILDAGRLTLKKLAEESRRVIEAAQKGKLEGVGQGVFTISNLGMFGVEEFSAIINPPEAAILAVGAIREAILVKDGAIRTGRQMTLSLSADHRIVDGLLAAKFLARLRELMESPEGKFEL
jgi:pyruvate dehydrogenase E2 component (dihydrolipoamide acetyltransferase)